MLEQIVALDVCHHAMPPFKIPHTLTEHHNTTGSEEIIIERGQKATILVSAAVPISANTIAQCPNLRLIAVSGVGVDHIDIDACRARGITVCNTPAATVEAVAEHAIALYFAVKRNIVQAHSWTVNGEKKWQHDPTGTGSFERRPIGCSQETVGLVGNGKIGQQIGVFVQALGMKLLIAERPGTTAQNTRPGRTLFEEVLQRSTTLILACPLDESTQNLITAREISMMRRDAIIVNIGRGRLVNEDEIAKALTERRLAGYGTDVFSVEPATPENCPLLRGDIPNLTVSPHIAWYNSTSVEKMQASIKAIVEGFVAGNAPNIVV